MPSSKFYYFLLSICLITHLVSFSQSDQYEVIPVRSSMIYSLNSVTTILGQSSTTVRIEIPQNTVAWFYIASVSKSSGTTTNLTSQLSKLISAKALAAIALSELFIPKGDAKCNFYLVDKSNDDLFEAKKRFNYFEEGSTKSTTEAKIQIKNQLQNLYYIAIDNPEFFPVKVSFEAAAIVKVNGAKYGSFSGNRLDWQGQNGLNVVNIIKTKLESHILFDMNKLIGTSEAISQLKECVVDKIISEYSLVDFLKLAAPTIDYEVMMKYKLCAPNFFYTQSEDEKKASTWGNLGWKSFENGDIDNCIKYSLKSLEITPLFFAKANLALSYLVKGMEMETIENYMECSDVLKNNKYPKQAKINSIYAAIQDIENEKKKKNLKDADSAISILKDMLRQYQ